MDYQELVSFEYWTFIAQILNLFIQILLFKRFLFKPVKKIIEQRQQQVDQIYSDANAAKEAAEKEQKDYEAHLSEIRNEAEEITQKAIASAKQQSEDILQQAQTEAASIRSKAEKDIEQDRKKVMAAAKEEISGMAVDIASKIVDREINEDTHKALIEEFINEFEEK